MIALFTKWFGPSTKSQLLDIIDKQNAQSFQVQCIYQDTLAQISQHNVQAQEKVANLVELLAQSVTEQSKSFNTYLEMVKPKGDPTVRQMDDAAEIRFEKEREAHRSASELDYLKAVGMPIDASLTDQLRYQDEIQRDLSSFLKDLN